jgi:2'-5' RNA ligase
MGLTEVSGWPEWRRAYRYGVLVVVPPDDLAAKADAIRRRFDPTSAAIFGAHITLTPPFVRAPNVADLERLAATLLTFPRFDLRYSSATTFPDSTVVYLPVLPIERVAALRASILETGLFATPEWDFVPHLTLSEFGGEPQAVLIAARDAGLSNGVIPIAHVTWIAPDPSFRFAVRDTFRLAR